MKQTRKAFWTSAVALLLCFSMLLGSTFAWFTDSANSNGNIVQSGNLDVEMYWSEELLAVGDSGWQNAESGPIFTYDNWEPGYTDVKYIKVKNNGNLSFKWRLVIEATGEVTSLADVIDVYYVNPVTAEITSIADRTSVGVLSSVIEDHTYTEGVLYPAGETATDHPVGETVLAVALHMQEQANNDYMGKSIGDGFTVRLVATQFSHEEDSFGKDYDQDALWPNNVSVGTNSAGASIQTTAENKVASAVALQSKDGTISADVPAGVAVEQGTSKLTLRVNDVSESAANISLSQTEATLSVDVHIDGVAEDNEVVMAIGIKELLPVGLNMGNYRFYHVEDGATVAMTLLSDGATPVHNNYEYDPATGDVVLYLKSFSEVALVADMFNAWNGSYAEELAGGTGTETDPYLIANADQFVYFGDLISNDNESYGGKYYKLLADINLGGGAHNFYPIGYHKVGGMVALADLDSAPVFEFVDAAADDNDYAISAVGTVAESADGNWYTFGGAFKGTFDGDGHTISNIYQNTWQLKGNYSGNYWNAAMGLFGYVNGGTVKNLTVDHFSSDGEFTPTGVIAAYATNSTFENIAITNCNPRVYNTGNGGIVGIGGNSDDPESYALTFTNITIDNSNTISALWGSWDVACGGLVGMFRGAGHVYMTNCHVAAQIDVYNDVCGNYQYYWYRYAGMMIGTNKNMKTDANGYTVPETEKFHAENCTVHFGEWNDYYYCELVANSLASYTHDHQFSRLTQIQDVSQIQDASGHWNQTGNFILMNGKTPTSTCYHIMTDTNGNLFEHKHDIADHTNPTPTETVNGETVLKENNQRIYLPFNQLFTGYGWGVKHIPVYNGENYAFAGITILDREVADSVVKFEANAIDTLPNGIAISVGDLFSESAENKDADKPVAIKPGSLMVTVEGVDENSNISAKFNRDPDRWENSTIQITGTGCARITIQDYYFCKTATLEVTVTEAADFDMFDLVLEDADNFLYRVGNQNAVTLASLFSSLLGNTVTANKATVEVANVNGDANGTVTANDSDWAKGTIQFSGTGVVKVTVSVGETKPITLYLEVVNATNVAENGKIGNYNTTSVLLGNTSVSTLYLNGGATLYGNGFTVDCTNSPINGSGSVSENYIIALVDAHLDNVKIVGKVYTEYGAQAANDYNRALVVSKGNSTITNCYLSNTASPIRLIEGSLAVKGTTVKGGNFANIDIRSGHLTVEDVTTINQALGNDKAADGTTVIGLGIVVFYENVDPALTSITVNGTLAQYNHISSNDKFTHEYATQFVNQMMTGDYAEYRTEINGVKWVNVGIVCLCDGVVPEDNRSDKGGYVGKAVSFMSKDGYVYTVMPDASSVAVTPAEYASMGQGAIAPAYSFDYTTKNYIAKTDGSNDYCYYENGKVLIAMDQGDTFEWDPFILTATKLGQTLNYTVTMNGKTYDAGEKIAFNTSDDYTVTYTYTDGYNYVMSNGKLVTDNLTYTQTVTISVSVIQPSAQHATFTFADTNTATEKITVNNKTYISATGVSATDKEWGYITVNGTKIFYPITEAQMKKNLLGTEVQVYYYVFKDAVTITDYQNGGTGGAQTYNAETTTMPSNLTVVNGMEAKYTDVNSACVDVSKLTKDGPSGEVWDFSASTTVSGTTKYNNYLAHSSPSGLAIKSGSRDYDAITVAQFSYTDAAGATYYYFVGYFMPNQVSSGSSGGSSPCVTPDTLVTLADGTQKRIDQVTYADQLLAWDFFKGEYTAVPCAIIFDHGYDNNTVIELSFSDGTSVKVVNLHQFFDADLNEYVSISADSVAQYVGHKFAKSNGSGFDEVTLVDYTVTEEYVEAWGIISSEHYNILVEGMLSTDYKLEDYDLFNYFNVGTDMRFDEEQMQADMEAYGLYTYEDFADVLTYDQFVAFNVQYFKIAVEKGDYTYDGILALIDEYLNK